MVVQQPHESTGLSNQKHPEAQVAVEGSTYEVESKEEKSRKQNLLKILDDLMQSPPPRKRSRSVSMNDEEELQSQMSRRKRRVHFSQSVTNHPIICRQEMSCDEISSTWMDQFDRTENRRDINSTIFLMQSGIAKNLSDDDFFCCRGLEHLVRRKDKMTPCKKSIGIALAMQKVLRKAGVACPEMVARAYGKYTIKSQQAAYKKALFDEASVTHSCKRSNTKR